MKFRAKFSSTCIVFSFFRVLDYDFITHAVILAISQALNTVIDDVTNDVMHILILTFKILVVFTLMFVLKLA